MLLRFVAMLTAALALAAPVAAQTRLNVAIGADVNVVEVNKTVLGPGFKALVPDVDLNVVGTVSRAIMSSGPRARMATHLVPPSSTPA